MSLLKAFEGCRVLCHSAWRPTPAEPEPDLNFVDFRFRRRLSMVSRMTMRVVHALLEGPPQPTARVLLYFISFRGEVNQQFKVHERFIREREVLPAAFSLSVFNTPPALTSMALGLKAGYCAVYPAHNHFFSALLGGIAMLKAAQKKSLLALVYADEAPVKEYAPLMRAAEETKEEGAKQPSEGEGLAFAVLLEEGPPQAEAKGAKGYALGGIPQAACETPERFLEALTQLSRGRHG